MDTHQSNQSDHQDNQSQSGGGQNPQEEKRTPLWPWFLAGAIVVGFIGVVLAIIYVPAPDIWTADAYVTAHYTSVAPRRRRCRRTRRRSLRRG